MCLQGALWAVDVHPLGSTQLLALFDAVCEPQCIANLSAF